MKVNFVFICFIFTWLLVFCADANKKSHVKKEEAFSNKEIDERQNIGVGFCENIFNTLRIPKVTDFAFIKATQVSRIRIYYHNDELNCVDTTLNNKPLSYKNSPFNIDSVMAFKSPTFNILPDDVRRLYIVEYRFDERTSKWIIKIFVENSGALIRVVFDDEGAFDISKDLTLGYI